MDMGRAFREEIGGYNNIYINKTTFTTTFTTPFTTTFTFTFTTIGGYNNIYINTTTFTTTFTFTFTTIGRYSNIYINTTLDHCQLKKEMKSLDISYSGTVSGQLEPQKLEYIKMDLLKNTTFIHPKCMDV